MDIEALAKGLYDACPTVKPLWEQLGEVTKGVWRDRAMQITFFNEDEDIEMPGKINIKTIQERLGGIPITGKFVEEDLGVAPAERDKRLVLWDDEQFPTICDKLIAFIDSRRGSTAVAAKPEPKTKTRKGAEKSGGDFDFGGDDKADNAGGFDFGGEYKTEDADSGFDFGGEAPAEESSGFFN